VDNVDGVGGAIYLFTSFAPRRGTTIRRLRIPSQKSDNPQRFGATAGLSRQEWRFSWPHSKKYPTAS
jgi:hypothetical protein